MGPKYEEGQSANMKSVSECGDLSRKVYGLTDRTQPVSKDYYGDHVAEYIRQTVSGDLTVYSVKIQPVGYYEER